MRTNDVALHVRYDYSLAGVASFELRVSLSAPLTILFIYNTYGILAHVLILWLLEAFEASASF